jgi:hypothetical protein
MFHFCKQIILFIKTTPYSGQEQVTDAYKGCNKPLEVTEGRKNFDWLNGFQLVTEYSSIALWNWFHIFKNILSKLLEITLT